MNSASEKRDLVKKWMIAQLRQRLRSARVSMVIDQWLTGPKLPSAVRFEFVLNSETERAIEDQARKTELGAERLE